MKPHDQRYCRSCNTYKHRSSFFVARGMVYDTYCVACRPKTLRLSAAILKTRLAKGLLTRIQYEEEIKRRKQNQVERGKKVGKRPRAPINNDAWDYAVASAKIALAVLAKHKRPTEQHEFWHNQARALLRLSLAEIKARRDYLNIATECPLWYDVVENTNTKLQALIASYPDGADKSPLQIF
jgi:hypothetical protein